MTTLNSNIIQWLIAEYGINYADIDNHKTATAMITHVVVTEQLGGFTERTFTALIADGYRVQQSNFTKSVLKQIGMYCAVCNVTVLCINSAADILSIISAKAIIVHRNDLRPHLYNLFCTTREVHDREQIVAANALGVSKMTDIILSRHRLPFLDQLCEDKGIIGEPVIFQTKDNKEKKVTSILGGGVNEKERAMYWILGEFLRHTLAHYSVIDPAWWCRKCWLHDQHHEPRQHRRGRRHS
jgi:hypothetical protein